MPSDLRAVHVDVVVSQNVSASKHGAEKLQDIPTVGPFVHCWDVELHGYQPEHGVLELQVCPSRATCLHVYIAVAES